MSGKQAKFARQVLASVKLPKLIIKPIAPGYNNYPIEADHNRRIRQLAKRMNITVTQAIALYTAKVGMGPKPKN